MIGSDGWKTTVDFNTFYNYAAHILRPQNTESGEPELNNVGEKSQDKNELIFHNTIINAIWNQITDTMQGFYHSYRKVIKCHLDKFQPSPFLRINNITVPV